VESGKTLYFAIRAIGEVKSISPFLAERDRTNEKSLFDA
jgi:hypothetical protein